MEAREQKPLSGIRVLELARILAGPWAGQILADLGADVIKVEQPETGDDTRGWGPPFFVDNKTKQESAAYFHSCNRGKRSIALDFRNEQDLAIVKELGKHADIVIENFKTGGLAKYHLDYASLCEVNRKLIYCSITGFGQNGPYAQRSGYDFLIQAMGGIMSLTGEIEGAPQKTGVAYADIFTGLYCVIAIQAALAMREKTGQGGVIDMALLDCQIGVLSNQALNYFATNHPPERYGNAHPTIVPYQLFQTLDDPVVILAGNDRQFRRLCIMLNQPDLADDPNYATNGQRVRNRLSLLQQLSTLLGRLPAQQILTQLGKTGVPCGLVYDLEGVFSDPQVIHRAMKIKTFDKKGRATPIGALACPIIYNGQRLTNPLVSPELDQDRQEILREIGWNQ